MHRFSLLLVNSSFLRALNTPHKRERIPPLPLTVSKALLSETTLCLLNSVWYYLCIRLYSRVSQDGRGEVKQRLLRLQGALSVTKRQTLAPTITAQGASEDRAAHRSQQMHRGGARDRESVRGSLLPEENRENCTESSRKSRGLGCAFQAKKIKKKSNHNS